LYSLLGNVEANDVGFLSRCLVTFPTSTIGTRMYREVDVTQHPDAKTFWEHIQKMLTLSPGEGLAEQCPKIRTLPLVPDAKYLWVDFHDHVEADLADGADYAPIRAFGAKAAEHALRWAQKTQIYFWQKSSCYGRSSCRMVMSTRGRFIARDP